MAKNNAMSPYHVTVFILNFFILPCRTGLRKIGKRGTARKHRNGIGLHNTNRLSCRTKSIQALQMAGTGGIQITSQRTRLKPLRERATQDNQEKSENGYKD